MNAELIKQKRREIAGQFGDWTAHSILLAPDTYTIEENDPERDQRIFSNGLHLRRIVQAASDAVGQPLEGLRVLDLACLEGMYAIEFARHGAAAMGIEGRLANIEKARFAAEALSLENIEFIQDDVRNLSVEKYGQFDVVLCLGILYHLDAPDVFHFAERVAEVCRKVAIFDTHYSLTEEVQHTFKGRTYSGKSFTEFGDAATPEEKEKSAWASLDNLESFWLTLPSLFNLFSDIGFTSAYTCFNPPIGGRRPDRDTFIALKGQVQSLYSTPVYFDRWTEDEKLGLEVGRSGSPDRGNILRRVVRRLLNFAR